MDKVEEIRFPRRLPDFGLSVRARRLRNRLTAIGYRLGRVRSRTEWAIYKVWFGAVDDFLMRTTSLDGVEEWLVKREQEIFDRADLTNAHQARNKF